MKRWAKKRGGFSIIAAVLAMVILSLYGGTIATLSIETSNTVVDEYASQQAFDVAQAGLQYTVRQMKDDTDWSDNAGLSRNYGPGQFTVSYVSKTTDAATVRLDGVVGGRPRAIVQSISRGQGTFNAMDYSLYTEGDIEVDGSSTGTVGGDVTARGTIDENGNVHFNGDIEDNNPNVVLPTPNWGYWQGVADHVITGSNYTFTAGTYTGIYYIDGDVNFQDDVTINGTVIVRGRVTSSGNSDVVINASLPNPALVAEDGITMTGTREVTLNGWVYSGGEITMTGNSNVNLFGGMGAEGDIEFSGNTDVVLNYNPDLKGTQPPGFTGGSTGTAPIVFGRWQETF